MSEYIVDFGSLAMLSRVVESESNRLGEPVVRCRDCVKWSFFDVEDGVRFGECAEFTAKVDKGCGHATREYGFCAWGERRGE